MADNTRDIEAGIHEDFREEMSYGSYLALDTLLDAQRPAPPAAPSGASSTVPSASAARPSAWA